MGAFVINAREDLLSTQGADQIGLVQSFDYTHNRDSITAVQGACHLSGAPFTRPLLLQPRARLT